MAISLPFQAGGYGTQANYNFISSMGIHKPDIDPVLTEAYGSQYLTGFFTLVGAEKPVSALKYSHFEEERIMPKIKATTAGAAAGAAATFTLDAAATLAISQQNPYIGASTDDMISPRVGDTIHIKPASGLVTAGTYIEALVTSVNKSAGTFVAYPTQSGVSTPAIGTADEIIIIGSAFGEGSSQPESMNSRVKEYTNTLQISKETFSITNTGKDVVQWIEGVGLNGKKGYFWTVKGEADTYKRFLNKKELTMLVGQGLTNTTLADVYAAAGEPITMTKGLIPSILAGGNNFNYSSATGFTKQDAEIMAKTLDKQKGSKSNMIAAGMNLSIDIDNAMADYNTAGAISYGNYTMGQEASRAFEFKSFSVGGYTFNKKTFDAFNDLQTLGAEGFGYADEAMIIPMDSTMDKGSNSRVQALRTRYLVGENGQRYDETTVVNNFQQAGGKDTYDVFYKAACGFEAFALNRFGYLKKA